VQTRAARRISRISILTLVVASVGAFGLSAASAKEVATPHCTTVSTQHLDASATRNAINRLNACLSELQAASDKAGHTAQVADEQYLRAKSKSDAANRTAKRTQSAANAAVIKAHRSRARAAVVAAHLARTGSGDQPTNLIIDGGGASQVLYKLSRMSQLSVESTRISRDAAADSRRATALEEKAAQAALTARDGATAARETFDQAKSDSNDAAALVHKQQRRVKALEAQLAALQPATHPASAPGSAAASGSVSADLPADASKAARAIAFARAQIGEPYVFAAAGPSSWDCSGLTMAAYASAGVNIGIHSATAQYDLAASRGQLVGYSDARPGDLLFYTDGGGDMYHVAIYSGDGNMIEAPYEGQNVREVPVRTSQLVGQVARPTA
jgi:peptidoglycan DL-endopeptidase CwlO